MDNSEKLILNYFKKNYGIILTSQPYNHHNPNFRRIRCETKEHQEYFNFLIPFLANQTLTPENEYITTITNNVIALYEIIL